MGVVAGEFGAAQDAGEGGGVFQHPCQSKDNSVGRGTIGILGHEYSR